MGKFILIMFANVVVFTITINAQVRTIDGTVTDFKGNPLNNVKVEVEGLKLFELTDQSGYFKFTSIPDSIYTLRFSHPDLEDVSSTIGISNSINIKMAEIGYGDIFEYSLEDLLNIDVSTASKKVEKSTNAPGIILTISKEEIKYFGANTLSDILDRATSIQSVGSHLFPNNVTAIRGDLRTLYDNHTLILIDGKPIRDGVMGGANSPFYQSLPIEMIEKIEIVRGPGSVLYGTNAFAGVINIITKDDVDENSFFASMAGGSFGTIGGSLGGTYSKSDFKAKFGTKIENVEGWDYEATTLLPGVDTIPISKKYGRQNIGFLSDISYKGFSLFGFYTYENQDILGVLPFTPFAGKNKISRLTLNGGYNHKFGESWEGAINFMYNKADIKLNDEALGIPFDHHECSDYLSELTFQGEIIENLNLTIGGVLDMRNKNNVGSNDAIPNTYKQTHLSTYIQSDYRPIKFLKLIAGAQINKPDVGDVDIVPRLGSILNFTDNLGLKMLYGSAFRSPWPVEQLLVNPAIVGNPNLGPEKISTLDIQLFFSSKKAEGNITFFNSSYSNSISRAPLSDTTSIFTYINQGELHMNGLELEGKVTVSSNIFITGSATIQNNVDEDDVAVYIPNFMGKFGAFCKTDFGLTIGIFNTFFAKPRENMGYVVNPEATAMDLLSINIDYKLPISTPVEISIYGKNLLNMPYYYTEFSRGWVNTLPMQPGAGIYGKISLQL